MGRITEVGQRPSVGLGLGSFRSQGKPGVKGESHTPKAGQVGGGQDL